MDGRYLRGELYYADLGSGYGSEQEGHRPVLILQNDVGNAYSPTVIVAAVTSKVSVKTKLPTHCYVDERSGLKMPSIILLEQLRTVDKQRLSTYIGRLNRRCIRAVNRALAISVGVPRYVCSELTGDGAKRKFHSSCRR
ncbi:MAG: type II toxin-antitoxin system PemK/MazF family toxin [Oscillospiraceae bacterium]|nr:type II toxin-antitoxin system PemK/MazF family toxin [Oscillospiraceae bacterium]